MKPAGNRPTQVADRNRVQPDDPDRRFRHARNANGNIDSICRRCQKVIASSADEWSLLADEEQHLCGTQTDLRTRATVIHQRRGM